MANEALEQALDAAMGGKPAKPGGKRARTLSDALDAAMQAEPAPQVNTRTFSQPVFEKGADPRKFFTEGLPNAYGAARETLAKPTYGQTLQQRYPWTKYTTAPALLHVGEFASRIFPAIGAGVAELGPEKAKPLTEAMASNLPFLYSRKPPTPLPRTVAADIEAGARRALPPGEQGQLAGGQRALPPPPPEGPTVPSFWPNPASLPTRERGQLPGRLYTPQLPPRRLGEDLRSKTYFPEKTPYQPERPLEIKGGAREGELLDQYGKPVKAPEPTMPERERLRTLYRGKIGGGPDEAARLETRMRDVATEAGAEYKGIQSFQGRAQYLVFNEPKFGSTLMLPIDQATPAAVRRKLAEKVEAFEKAQQPPTVTGKVTPATTVPQVSPPSRLAPPSEMTKMGEQGIIGGTPARAIPTSKLASKAPQSKITESPLFAKPETAVQQPLEPPPTPKPSGQHYGKTVSPGTAILSDAEEVRMLIRDGGGINPASTGLDLQSVPKEFLNPKGRSWDEVVTEIAEAQGKRPKDVERELTRTFARYGSMRQELKAEGLFTEIRAKEPPPDLGVSVEEWRTMPPSSRRALIEWTRMTLGDESGRLDLGKMVDAWKRFRQRLPMEEAVRGAVPDSPVISEVERWNVGLADGIKAIARSPWWKAIRKMSPEATKDLDEAMVQDWMNRLPPTLKARMQNPKVTLTPPEIAQMQTARNQAIAAHATPELRAAMGRRDVQFARENQSRTFFGADPIPEEYGPYLPRITDKDFREAVSLGGGRLGVGRGLQTTVRGHGQERVFQTYRQGEAAGTVYEHPSNAILMREWEGLKLRATHRLFQNLEQKGVLFKNRAAATAASPTRKPFLVEDAPGGEWWARTEQEARFLRQNLTESTKGPTGSFVHYGNMLIRNPSLVQPLPHIVKNMWAKALLARGPISLYSVPRDAVEYFRGANPTLLAEFKDAMPFSSSGRTAGEILGNELRRSGAAEALRLAHRAIGALNRPSSKVIFEWADPAMRYSLFKHYRGQGLSPYAAANHAWVDLIRYGTRSDIVDAWKAWPLNFFVPWRYGTLVSLIKQVKNHPIRTALLVGGIDYLREMRYRASGKWTHMPWDYTENPVAIVVQNAIDQKKSGAQQTGELAGILAMTRWLGPGGGFAAGQMVDAINDVRGRGDWERTKNMFWGISQLYNLPQEWQKFQETGDTKYLADILTTAALGEHNALTYQPRRLMRDLPEYLPGMTKSELVNQAEAAQARKAERTEKSQQRRQEHPAKTIEDRLREAGYLR